MQSRELKTILFINVELLILLVFLLVLPFVEGKQTGTLNLSWSLDSSRTVESAPATLRVVGRADGGKMFVRDEPYLASNLTLDDIPTGKWDISLQVLDEEEHILARSSAQSIEMRKGVTESVQVVLKSTREARANIEAEVVDVSPTEVKMPIVGLTPPIPTSLKVSHQACEEKLHNVSLSHAVQESYPSEDFFSLDGAVFDQPVLLSFDVQNPKFVGLNGMKPVLMDKPLYIDRDTIVQIVSEDNREPITKTFRIRVATPSISITEHTPHGIQVSLHSETKGALLRYSIKDETYPYTGPFFIHENTQIEVIAVKQGMQPSYHVSKWVEIDKNAKSLPEPIKQSSEEEIPKELTYTTPSSIPESYQVGDIGPAGGVIFFDKGFYSDNWRYLEAAPQDEKGMYRWGQYGYFQDICEVEEGYGVTNSKKVVTNELPIDCALYVCQQKTLVVEQKTYDDWFLPSRNELKILLAFKDVAGLNVGNYWSSSELSSVLAWQVHSDTLKESQSYKNAKQAVRAVRSF